MIRVVAGIIVGYLLGSVLTGQITAALARMDIKKKGSGNPGATNVFRVIGPLAGTLVLAGDVLKGLAAIALGRRIGGGAYLPLYGLAAIIGHNWSVFHRFQGGKGIATTLGAILFICPKVLWIVFPGWLIGVVGLGFVSLGALFAAVLLPLAVLVFYPGNGLLLFFGTAAALMAVYRHIPNIRRILKGEEHRAIALFRRKGDD